MRPRKLTIEGFTCYADPVEIDFSKLDVFVICGPTGAGKTTIIDAMCYALYGKIPRQSDAGQLMSHNRDTLRVALEFAAADQRYRVIRSINVTRKTARDGSERVTRNVSPVQIDEFDGDEWQPLEGRVRRIDDEIERIVGLDFDAFQRCVVLPQGRFQEFLAGDRGDRSRILKDLLDIGVYERVMQAANQRHRDAANRVTHIEQQLRDDYADATPEALAECRDELARVTPTLESAKQQREALSAAAAFAVTVVNARARAKERNEQHAKTLAQIEEAERLGRAGRDDLRRLRNDCAAAEAQLKDLRYDRDLHNALQRAADRAAHVGTARAALEDAKKQAADRAKLDAADHALAAATKKHTEAEAAVRAAEDKLAAAHRADAAAHVRSGLKPGDSCPVCGGVVGTLPKAAATSDLKAGEKALASAQTAERAARTALTDAERIFDRERQNLKTAADAVARIESEIAQSTDALQQILPKGVDRALESIAAALKAQEAAARTADDLAKRIDQLRKHTADLEPRVTQSAEHHAGLTATAKRLADEAAEATREGDEAIAELRKHAKKWQWASIIDLIESKQSPRDALDAMLKQTSADCDDLTAEQTTLEQRAIIIEQKIARAGELRAQLDESRSHAQLARELGLLLRADAFQQYVISSAMHVLAASATEHLETLYPRFAIDVDDGQFQVIDHWQADQKRPARTLSGGETFVASLALGLALSERLPELRSAAAARLESLFLDEGFGTLDAVTLETVITALEGLRSEERMVGIITHVPELAQRIETRVEVTASPTGSTLTLIGA